MCDLLWSDPMDESTADYLDDDALEEWYAIEYTDNPARGCGWVFGGQAIDDFLMDNDLLTVVRGIFFFFFFFFLLFIFFYFYSSFQFLFLIFVSSLNLKVMRSKQWATTSIIL